MSRDLDAKLAETVFGYTRGLTPKDANGEHGGNEYLLPPGGIPKGFELPRTGKIGFPYFAPQYTGTTEEMFSLIGVLNRAGVEVVMGCFPGRAAGDGPHYCVELRRWRDRRVEGVPGDPHTGRAHETFVLESGSDLPAVLGEAVLRSGLKL